MKSKNQRRRKISNLHSVRDSAAVTFGLVRHLLGLLVAGRHVCVKECRVRSGLCEIVDYVGNASHPPSSSTVLFAVRGFGRDSLVGATVSEFM